MTINRSKTIVASAARTASGNGSAIGDCRTRDGVAFYLNVSAQAGTAPTLDVDIEGRDVISGLWAVIASFAQVGATTGTFRAAIADMPETEIRAAWTIGGSAGQSFTFSVGMVAQDD